MTEINPFIRAGEERKEEFEQRKRTFVTYSKHIPDRDADGPKKEIRSFMWVAIFFFFMTQYACGKRHVQIDRDTRIAIDTLVSQQINDLRPLLDSLCALKMDSLVVSMRDSVFEVRQEEMRKLIGE